MHADRSEGLVSLLDRIRAGTKNHQVILWPGSKTVRVRIRILSRGELQEAVFAAKAHFKASEIEVELVMVEAFEDEKTVQVLFRALEGADGDELGKAICSDIDVFRNTVTRDELNELAQAYEILEHECSPNPETMPDDQFNAFLETLKKKPDEMIGSVRNIAFARRLLRSLVNPPET